MHLQIGEINGFNLTRYASVPTPYLSPPYDVAVKTGDQDGINLPWFARADSTLLFWDIHHDLAFMRFRLRVVDGNTVEIWPESSVWVRVERDNVLKSQRLMNDCQNEHDPQMTPALPPLLVLTNVSVAAAGSIKVQLPHGVLNSSPSQTFVVRRVIGSMLVPSGLLLSEAMAWTYPAIVCMLTWVHVVINISGIYAVVVLVWWCLKGRPPFWQWMRSFWLTRGLIVCLGPLEQKRSTIWSATGPVEDEDEAGLDDTAIVGPRPLSNATDFFRSSSPLDDLLFTFESTRHLVQPLMFRRRGQDGPRSMSVRRFIQLDPTNHRFGKDIEAGNMAPWLSEKSRS